MRRKSSHGLAFALLVAGCAGGPKLDFDYDHDADFARYRTYGWAAGGPGVRVNPVVHKIIVTGVDEQLAKKGLARVDSTPDAFVTYHGGSAEETVVDTDFYGYGYGPGWYAGGAPAPSSAPVTKYSRGTLIVDLWDARTKRLIWRGIATDIRSDDPAVNAEKARVAVDELFARYPPGAAK
jgi:hypothetical protein